MPTADTGLRVHVGFCARWQGGASLAGSATRQRKRISEQKLEAKLSRLLDRVLSERRKTKGTQLDSGVGRLPRAAARKERGQLAVLRRSQYEVPMVGHRAIRQYVQGKLFVRFAHDALERLVVGLRPK